MSETIVVGYDGKDPSGRALDRAIDVVKSGGGTVVVVVVEYMPVDPLMAGGTLDPVPLAPSMPNVPVPPEEEPWLATDGPLPPALEALIEAAGVTGDYLWRFGDPGRAIADVAKDERATKIMIGRDQRGFLGRLFGDDVQAEVEREAPCEVVVVD